MTESGIICTVNWLLGCTVAPVRFRTNAILTLTGIAYHSIIHCFCSAKNRGSSCSLLGLFLITSLLALLLVFLLSSLLPVDVFESLEFFNEEGSHDSVFDFSSSVSTTIGSADCSLRWSQSSEIVWSSNLNSLHASSSCVLFDQMKNKSAT